MARSELEVIENVYYHDLSACDIYKQVITHVNDQSIRSSLNNFLEDHERHVQNLGSLLKDEFSKKPPESKDLKGNLLSAYTSLRSVTGQDGALKALQTAESTVLDAYKDALASVSNQRAKNLIQSQMGDEENHNRYIASVVD